MKLVHRIYGILLFFQFSETYRLIALALHAQTVIISTATLGLNLIYILANLKVLGELLKKVIFVHWFFYLTVLPIISFFISVSLGYMSVSELQYWFFFDLLFATLFLTSAIFAMQVPLKWMKILVISCILSTIVGFILNWTSFDLFRQMGQLSNNDNAWVVYGGDLSRGISFFEQGNRAAFSVLCFFILLLGLQDMKVLQYIFVMVLLLALIIITGSRTSLFITFIVFLYFIQPIAKAMQKKNGMRADNVYATIFFAILFGVTFILVALFTLSSVMSKLGYTQLAYRLDLSNIISSSGTVEDKSLMLRINIISVYWDYIEKNFLFGYGPAFVHKKLSSDAFANVSQNQYLENSIYYGVPYVLYYVYILFYSYFNKSSITFKNYPTNMIRVFVAFIFVLGFSISNMYWNRSLVISVGLVVGLCVASRKEFYKSAFSNEKKSPLFFYNKQSKWQLNKN